MSSLFEMLKQKENELKSMAKITTTTSNEKNDYNINNDTRNLNMISSSSTIANIISISSQEDNNETYDISLDSVKSLKQNLIISKKSSYEKRKLPKQRLEFTMFNTKLPRLITIKPEDLVWTVYPTDRVNIFGNTLFCGRIIRTVECERIPYIIPPYPTAIDNFEIVEIFCGIDRYERYDSDFVY